MTKTALQKQIEAEARKQWERALETQIVQLSLPTPRREFEFHPRRKFRADFAWPSYGLIVEVDGGVWSDGRHTRGEGYTRDCEKQAEAVLLGYQYLRFTPAQVESGYAAGVIERILKQR